MTTPAPSGDRKTQLHSKIEDLNTQEIIIVDKVVTSILAPAEHTVLKDSWLTTKEWAEAFLALLRVHHGLSREPLGTLQFEAAFNDASEAAGWTVSAAAGATNRFFDTVIVQDGTRMVLSLKSTAAKGLKENWVEISKLTEGAWIQDARRQAERRDRIVALFKEYRDITDGIVILRAFREEEGVRYQLVEIPTSLFEAVDSLSVENAQKGTIPFPADAVVPMFKIGIDRSDAKVKLHVHIGAATIHGQWKLSGEKESR
ncbi:hypothetical protein PY310_19820 [Pseudarthrobacter sp. H3Y2-7]|uniref:hypothetical protein n=1 Tax=Pseudarthrobacter naphthalenicus TaxID=3031328 RepID=UPI0023AEDAE1|nr:hypothetical protein [Pseudarthrobacter sp. H3Y2-7]MDE8670823.1 hypothetical protein [Pseudarthrobacter sp. H3Y2-7]